MFSKLMPSLIAAISSSPSIESDSASGSMRLSASDDITFVTNDGNAQLSANDIIAQLAEMSTAISTAIAEREAMSTLLSTAVDNYDTISTHLSTATDRLDKVDAANSTTAATVSTFACDILPKGSEWFATRSMMESTGWVFSSAAPQMFETDRSIYCPESLVPAASYCGFESDAAELSGGNGRISIVVRNSGSAIIDFGCGCDGTVGGCSLSGYVSLNLNGVSVRTANVGTFSTVVVIKVTAGDVIDLSENDISVMVLNSITFNCDDKLSFSAEVSDFMGSTSETLMSLDARLRATEESIWTDGNIANNLPLGHFPSGEALDGTDDVYWLIRFGSRIVNLTTELPEIPAPLRHPSELYSHGIIMPAHPTTPGTTQIPVIIQIGNPDSFGKERSTYPARFCTGAYRLRAWVYVTPDWNGSPSTMHCRFVAIDGSNGDAWYPKGVASGTWPTQVGEWQRIEFGMTLTHNAQSFKWYVKE